MSGARSITGSFNGTGSWLRITGSIPSWIGRRETATGLALFMVFVAFLAAVQFSTPNLAGNDGYYHIKIASLMRSEGLKLEFSWLPLTILNAEEFVDHHFLFHVLLIPFTFGNLVMGAKWASVLFAAAAFLSIWWLLHSQKVPGAPVWAIGALAISEAFIFRMSMPRVQALSLVVLVLALHWTLTGRHRFLVPLAFAYVWLYDAFPLILIVTAAWSAAHWVLNGHLDLRPVGYAGLGLFLGIVFHPYFPNNVEFAVRHILPKLTDATSISVGSEWFPYKTTQLLENSGIALAALVSGVFALGLSRRRMNVSTATALILTMAFALMVFLSRRFIEYFPPFALIFTAFAWAPILQRRIDQEGPQNAEISKAFSARPRRKVLLAFLSGAVLITGLFVNLRASRESIGDSKPAYRYGGASAWLAANTPVGSMVFQTDWDDFPRLYFFNSHNAYTIGLDPTYMQIYDAELYEHWTELTQGRSDDLSAAVLETFGARFVITDLAHNNFLNAARDDPEMTETYRDEYAAIFEIVSE